MDDDEYLAHDGLGLAQRVAAGETTAADLLAAARRRASAVNAAINAVCAWTDDHADERSAAAPAGPFGGVPFLLKDLHQHLAGYPTSDGCRALADRTRTTTSTVVQRWLDAGLVILGKTNTPEFGSKGITEPDLFGPTRNPFDLTRTPGGSSGGSAAAVAAGIVPVAAASDGGGSIRIPAACTGLVGLKPGRGLVPFGPDESEPLNGIATNGVVSRSVRDSAAMLDVLAGEDDMSPFAPALPDRSFLSRLEEPVGPLRIGYATASVMRSRPHPEAVAAVEHAARVLTDLGHHVEEVAPPHHDEQLARDFLTIWFVHQAIEIDRIVSETGVGEDAFELDTRLMAAVGRSYRATELQAAEDHRRDHVAGLAAFHRDYDLLMTPTLGEPPIAVGSLDTPAALQTVATGVLRARAGGLLRRVGVVDHIVDRNLSWVPYTQLANITGRPAISLPLSRTADGLPMGVQFVGRLRGEELLLRLARRLEEAVDWRRPLAEVMADARLSSV